MTYTQIKGDR